MDVPAGLMKYVAYLAASFMIYGFGVPVETIYPLVYLILLDFILGFARAIYQRKLNSKICLNGIIRKICTLGAVVLAHFVDIAIGASQINLFRDAAITMLVIAQIVSCLENLVAIDAVPVPYRDRLLRFLDSEKIIKGGRYGIKRQ